MRVFAARTPATWSPKETSGVTPVQWIIKAGLFLKKAWVSAATDSRNFLAHGSTCTLPSCQILCTHTSARRGLWPWPEKKQIHFCLFFEQGKYGFPNSHVWMWELDHKESWAPKNWCFWTVVLEKTPESPLDSKEIHPVRTNWNQSRIFIGRTDAEAETPILWPPDVKNWPFGKDPDAEKDWRWGEKGMTEDEMVGWHHQLDGHEFEQTPGVGDGQGGLACCSPRGHKQSDTAERLN